MDVDPESLPRPPSAAYRVASLPPPPVPPKDDGYTPSTVSTRPNTGTTRRFSHSTAISRRTIKYATWGRFAGMELSPQPSDDADDPLVSGSRDPESKKEQNQTRGAPEGDGKQKRGAGVLTDIELAPVEERTQPFRPPPPDRSILRHENRPHPRQCLTYDPLRHLLLINNSSNRRSSHRLCILRTSLRRGLQSRGKEARLPRVSRATVRRVGVGDEGGGFCGVCSCEGVSRDRVGGV